MRSCKREALGEIQLAKFLGSRSELAVILTSKSNLLKRLGSLGAKCMSSVYDWSIDLYVDSARHLIWKPPDFTEC